MKWLKILYSWFMDSDTRIDFLTDIRTISAATCLVGGVSRFFGFTNPLHVTIASGITWMAASADVYLVRKK